MADISDGEIPGTSYQADDEMVDSPAELSDVEPEQSEAAGLMNGNGHIRRRPPSNSQHSSIGSSNDTPVTARESLRERIIHKAHDVQHKVEEAAHNVEEAVEDVANKIYVAGWRLVSHTNLPEWMKDNEFIHFGYRPELRSFVECFKSVFRIHTETGNIWSHLLGMMAFLGITGYFLSRPSEEVQWEEKAVFSAFFFGAIICLGFSWIFHTVCCHSSPVGKFFNKLDYCGISVLTVGSFVPWLYYCFYCRLVPKVCYLALIFTLGACCTVFSLMDKFQTPKYRPVRAGMFIALGLSGVIPALHFVITDGFYEAVHNASLGWLCLMAFCYIFGAVIYAVRIPERIWPGKFDIWFHSHQIFHIFVIAGAMVHYHGITQIANYRLTEGDCLDVVPVM